MRKIFFQILILTIIFVGHAYSNDSIEVLIIGDSHTCLTFGKKLDQMMRDKFGNNQVVTIGRSGERSAHYYSGNHSTDYGWLDIHHDGTSAQGGDRKATPKIDDLLSAYKPKIVIIALGANEIWLPGNLATHLSGLAKKVSATKSQCYWVAPPITRCDKLKCVYTREQLSKYYSILFANTATSCQIIKNDPDSAPFLDFNKLIKEAGRNGDGIHFDTLGIVGRNASTLWAQRVAESIN